MARHQVTAETQGVPAALPPNPPPFDVAYAPQRIWAQATGGGLVLRWALRRPTHPAW
jgi:hypothetical protein